MKSFSSDDDILSSHNGDTRLASAITRHEEFLMEFLIVFPPLGLLKFVANEPTQSRSDVESFSLSSLDDSKATNVISIPWLVMAFKRDFELEYDDMRDMILAM